MPFNSKRKHIKDSRKLLDEDIHDKRNFKVVFMAGGPGSGKGWIIDNVAKGHGLRVIGSDTAFEHMYKEDWDSFKI